MHFESFFFFFRNSSSFVSPVPVRCISGFSFGHGLWSPIFCPPHPRAIRKKNHGGVFFFDVCTAEREEEEGTEKREEREERERGRERERGVLAWSLKYGGGLAKWYRGGDNAQNTAALVGRGQENNRRFGGDGGVTVVVVVDRGSQPDCRGAFFVFVH